MESSEDFYGLLWRADKALLHIAVGVSGFDHKVRGRLQLERARKWLMEEPGRAEVKPEALPTKKESRRQALIAFRSAWRDTFGPDQLKVSLPAFVWIWFACQRLPEHISDECRKKWLAFMTNPKPPTAQQVSEAEEVLQDFALCEFVWQRFGPEVARQQWRLAEAERPPAQGSVKEKLLTELERVAKAYPKLLVSKKSGKKPFRSTLNRFELYAVVRSLPQGLKSGFATPLTILRTITDLVTAKRGAPPKCQRVGPEAAELEDYVESLLRDKKWKASLLTR